ncbi:aminoacyl-tRNA hydrolase [Candidatus Uhrbacteria bacterium]|nr:aminoacyl-tRNA hydrolase [Candidatus Uhrbacteria bacterium]
MPLHLLCIGLGNPGSEYLHTRHNVGFRVIDTLAAQLGCTLRRSTRHHAMTARCTTDDARTLLLAQPLTFMNASGLAFTSLTRQYHPEMIIICSDDLDLPIGTLRWTRGGSSGGHRGLQSIIDAGGKDTLRLRIGIGTNRTTNGHRIPAEDFVLQQFSSTELATLAPAIVRATAAILLLAHHGFDAAQQFANTRPETPS